MLQKNKFYNNYFVFYLLYMRINFKYSELCVHLNCHYNYGTKEKNRNHYLIGIG